MGGEVCPYPSRLRPVCDSKNCPVCVIKNRATLQ